MTPILHIDFETRSALELRDVGLWNYARHPSTAAWCMAHAIGEEEPELWELNRDPVSMERLFDHVRAGRPVAAHNAAFELAIWNQVMVPRFGWPELKPAQMICTMAAGYAMGLPGALEDAALALGLKMLKDTEGRALMLRYSKPWRTDPLQWLDECPSFVQGGRKWTGAEGLARLFEYSRQDVRVERELRSRLMPLSAQERQVWLVDYAINQRGVQLDVETTKASVAVAETIKGQLDVEMAKVTGGAVQTCTAVLALKDWLAGLGVHKESLAKQEIVDLIPELEASSNPNAELALKALRLRQEAGKASTAKFDTMASQVGDDGRLHGLYQYCGAATGRWAGRGVQIHNLPRDMPKPAAVESIVGMVRKGDYRGIDLIYGPPLTAMSRCLRSYLVAPEGKLLVGGDFANVEGRGQAWFAGEDWKLQAFREADAGTGPGLYELAYSRMFHVPVESVKNPSEERQIGKVAELACIAAGTPVLTSNGMISIEQVTINDRVWDGGAWVKHAGLVQRGVRPVVTVAGTRLTADHLVLTGQTWTPAQLLASSDATLRLALATGSAISPWSPSPKAPPAGKALRLELNVTAAQLSIALSSLISGEGSARDALRAAAALLPLLANCGAAWLRRCLMTSTAADCLTDSQLPFAAVRRPTTPAISTTADAASTFATSGSSTVRRFYGTFRRLLDGTIRRWKWIDGTQTDTTNPATSDSSRGEKTEPTDEQYRLSNADAMTYDLAFAGPRNRFAILTGKGLLIVHNCGYQGGIGSFHVMGKTYGVKVSDAEADRIKRAWRAAHPNIVNTWYDIQRAAMQAVRNPGEAFTCGVQGRHATFKMAGSFLWCQLPSGRVICYPFPKILPGDFGDQLTYMTQPSPEDIRKGKIIYDDAGNNTPRWARIGTYGGALFNNIVQGFCRDILRDLLLWLHAYSARIVIHTHDDCFLEVAKARAEGARAALEQRMNTPDSWLLGFPLKAKCVVTKRYGK